MITPEQMKGWLLHYNYPPGKTDMAMGRATADYIEKLEEDLTESLSELFFNKAYKRNDGTWDTMALSYIVVAGDQLVELGILEKLPGGHGRRQFYKEIK